MRRMRGVAGHFEGETAAHSDPQQLLLSVGRVLDGQAGNHQGMLTFPKGAINPFNAYLWPD